MNILGFQRIVLALAVVLCLSSATECLAQSKPLWIVKGEKSMNKKRQSDNYTFKVFNTHGRDRDMLKAERLKPLLEYLQGEYGVDTSQMSADTTVVASDGSKAIKISMSENGISSVVYAKLVDDYSEFTDYELNVFQYEFYQLYAVTNKNAEPVFDKFNVVETNNSAALVRSIIPGMGQLYKGQRTKAYVILGGEVACVASALVCQHFKHRYDKDRHNDAGNADSWRSKSRSWRQMRNMSIGLACGLYVYNLIDAATAKTGHRLQVGKGSTLNVAIVPMQEPLSAGVSLALRF